MILHACEAEDRGRGGARPRALLRRTRCYDGGEDAGYDAWSITEYGMIEMEALDESNPDEHWEWQDWNCLFQDQDRETWIG